MLYTTDNAYPAITRGSPLRMSMSLAKRPRCHRDTGPNPGPAPTRQRWATDSSAAGLGENLRLLRRELLIGEDALVVELGELLQLIG